MDWNKLSGNSYTASLWVSVSKALCDLKTGQSMTAFSYGSGCGAELLSLTAGPDSENFSWSEDVAKDLAAREKLSTEAYVKLRAQS